MQCKSGFKSFVAGALVCGLLISSGYTSQNYKVVQIDISKLLNVRPITTLNSGKLTHWTKGVDRENGYLTASAAKFIGEADPNKSMPDNSMIAAGYGHPAIQLHYSNNDASNNQAVLLADTDAITIKVPKSKYKDLYICLTSAYGKSKLEYDLIYSNGSEVKNIIVPDWANNVKDGDPDFSYVVHDLPKWSNTGKQTEPNNHNIHALNVHPNGGRTLTAIRIKNQSKTYLLFWAATGVQI